MTGFREAIREARAGMAEAPGVAAVWLLAAALTLGVFVTAITVATVATWPYGVPTVIALAAAWWLLRTWIRKGAAS